MNSSREYSGLRPLKYSYRIEEKNKMAKSARKRGRPAIKPYIEGLIKSRVWAEDRKTHQKRTSPKVLADEIYRYLVGKGEKQVPQRSTIEKKISRYRSPGDSDLGKRWFLSSMAKYPIPSEALPTVMDAHAKRLGEDSWLTIGEALWIGRLYPIIEPKELVLDWAFFYAFNEQIEEETGVTPWPDLDSELIEDVYYARRAMRDIELWGIAEKYGASPEKLKELNLPPEEVEAILSMREEQDKLFKELEQEARNERKHKAKRQK
jgi:hypothetical protein